MIGTLWREYSTFRTTKPSCWKLNTLGLGGGGGVKSFDLFQQQKDIVKLLVYKIEWTSTETQGVPAPKWSATVVLVMCQSITIATTFIESLQSQYIHLYFLQFQGDIPAWSSLEWNVRSNEIISAQSPRIYSNETQGKITFSVHVPSETMRNKCFDANLWELIIEHIFICYQINWLLYSLKHARLILTTHRQQCPILTKGIYFSSDSPVSRGSQASWVACARHFAQLSARIWSVLESYIRLNRSGVPGLLPPSDIRKEIGRKRTPLDPRTCWRIRFLFKRKPFKVPKMRACMHKATTRSRKQVLFVVHKSEPAVPEVCKTWLLHVAKSRNLRDFVHRICNCKRGLRC